jgi:hypothetical protein
VPTSRGAIGSVVARLAVSDEVALLGWSGGNSNSFLEEARIRSEKRREDSALIAVVDP